MDTSIPPDQSLATIRRLVLAKEMYLHGLDHSQRTGSLNNMIAVHNMHNAIEILLRTIISVYQIAPKIKGKSFPSFEDLITAIDNHFQQLTPPRQLPFRGELMRLNNTRNAVQHDATEPAPTSIDDFKVFTRAFLRQAFTDYFSKDFDTLSPVDLIEDLRLQTLLKLSQSELSAGKINDSLTVTKFAFNWAEESIQHLTPKNKVSKDSFSSFPLPAHLLRPVREHDHKLGDALEYALKAVYEQLLIRIHGVAEYASLLSTGLDITDYNKFQDITPQVHHTLIKAGKIIATLGNTPSTIEDAEWAHIFVTELIVHWQMQGLKPSIVFRYADAEKWFEQLLTNVTIEYQ